jgi:DNA polymerase (family 10)
VIVYNSEIAKKLRRLADLLEIKQANKFRVRAYRDAARTIDRLSGRIQEMVEKGKDLTVLSGVGEDMESKLQEIVNTGELKQLKELAKEIPLELTHLLKIPGMGPKKVGKLFRELGVTSVKDLSEAVENNEVKELEGFGPETVNNISTYIKNKSDKEKERRQFIEAEQIVEPLLKYLRETDLSSEVSAAGSYRRRKETVGDIDILAVSDNEQEFINYFTKYSGIKEIVSQGSTKSTVILNNEMQVDLRVVAAKSAGAGLLYFTGSKAHNIKLRDMALENNWKLNEYGVFEGDEQIAGKSEQEVYNLLDLQFIAPELREERGEIEAAKNNSLPELIEQDDIKGDLQMHTINSDGHSTMKEMALKAEELGYEYILITDHTSYVGVTQGLDEKEVDEYIRDIRDINSQIETVKVLAGIEVDILEDGNLYFSNEALAKFDFTVGSIHTHFDLPADQQTERLLKAMENKHLNIIAHPTGRKVVGRPPYNLDLNRVFEAAADKNCILEINSHPSRLDLNEINAKKAKNKGVKLAISTDAHSIEELSYVKYGIYQARRGWIEKDDVVNTHNLDDLRNLLSR